MAGCWQLVVSLVLRPSNQQPATSSPLPATSPYSPTTSSVRVSRCTLNQRRHPYR